ncbi:MAG: hypothetical protein L0H63_05640 [Nitrococcus sp.]|nr:hypothetical protein [Nitrococcus sp.]
MRAHDGKDDAMITMGQTNGRRRLVGPPQREVEREVGCARSTIRLSAR